ncbi:MAG: CvpA family protein [Alphaproteobacteria bacterium]|jgi:membrane protein required for colicin V production
MFNVLDLVILGVLIVSALLAAWRGFTHEVLSIGSWAGAAVVMFLVGPHAVPLAAVYLDNPTLAQIAAYAAVFVIALIPLSYISYRISEGVRGSAIGPVDRLLGLVFGAARGLVVIGIGFLVFTSLVGESRLPDWFKDARLRPLMEGSGKVIASLMPGHGKPKADGKDADAVIGGRKPAAGDEEPTPSPSPTPAPKPKPPRPAEPESQREPEKAKPAAADAGDGTHGYGERERDALDQLIGTATASPSEGEAADGESGGHR